MFGGRDRARVDREAAARVASMEAAEEDPLFEAERVIDRASALFVAIQRAWSALRMRPTAVPCGTPRATISAPPMGNFGGGVSATNRRAAAHSASLAAIPDSA